VPLKFRLSFSLKKFALSMVPDGVWPHTRVLIPPRLPFFALSTATLRTGLDISRAEFSCCSFREACEYNYGCNNRGFPYDFKGRRCLSGERRPTLSGPGAPIGRGDGELRLGPRFARHGEGRRCGPAVRCSRSALRPDHRPPRLCRGNHMELGGNACCWPCASDDGFRTEQGEN
jgi:hypothetical protein